jgi:hypothetical protein
MKKKFWLAIFVCIIFGSYGVALILSVLDVIPVDMFSYRECGRRWGCEAALKIPSAWTRGLVGVSLVLFSALLPIVFISKRAWRVIFALAWIPVFVALYRYTFFSDDLLNSRILIGFMSFIASLVAVFIAWAILKYKIKVEPYLGESIEVSESDHNGSCADGNPKSQNGSSRNTLL